MQEILRKRWKKRIGGCVCWEFAWISWQHSLRWWQSLLDCICHSKLNMLVFVMSIFSSIFLLIITSQAKTYSWDLAQRYPFIRKIMAIMVKYVGQPHAEKNGGVVSVDLQGNPVEHYYDRDLTMVSSATKIGEHLYCGSVKSPYMLRLNLKQNPAVHTS